MALLVYEEIYSNHPPPGNSHSPGSSFKYKCFLEKNNIINKTNPSMYFYFKIKQPAHQTALCRAGYFKTNTKSSE